MTVAEILLAGGGGVLLLLTLIQITPIKINPWSAIAKAIGRAINGEVIGMLSEVKSKQESTSDRLNEHIRMDDERNADEHRARMAWAKPPSSRPAPAKSLRCPVWQTSPSAEPCARRKCRKPCPS